VVEQIDVQQNTQPLVADLRLVVRTLLQPTLLHSKLR
jgi:hypothetical protein